MFFLTAPKGLPWNESSHLAILYAAGETGLPHPVWGRLAETFAGNAMALSSILAALAAGFVALLVCRYCDWRLAVLAAVCWIFSPWVWNRAITGERSVCLVSAGVIGLWVLSCVIDRVLCRICAVRWSESGVRGVLGPNIQMLFHVSDECWDKLNRVIGCLVIGAAVLYATCSALTHDYRLGESASVYARGVVESAAGRIIIMNGLCDDQVKVCVGERDRALATVSVCDRSDTYRERLAQAVSRTFPGEKNLWLAAHLGAETFAEAAVKAHPKRFYSMDGRSTSFGEWERRWNEFCPYLDSIDPFVPVARRAFGYEGNAVANALLAEGSVDSARRAWQLYMLVGEKVDPGNISALVNMSEMIRGGYSAKLAERQWIQGELDRFLQDATRRHHARELSRAAGPVRSDSELLMKMVTERRRRLAAKVASGEEPETPTELLTLVEWSNEMVGAMDRGEIVKAGRLARKILSNVSWRNYVPALAVLGAVSSAEGDYAASAAFFAKATNTTSRVPAATLNDFADTMFRLGRLDEAETLARKAVEGSDGKYFIARLTLAQVLIAQRKDGDELDRLCKDAIRFAPTNIRDKVRMKIYEARREVQ